MHNFAQKKLFRKRWFKVSLIILLALILLAILYGRQTYATFLIYSRYEKEKSYMHLTPELRNLTPIPVQESTVFKAFGYTFDVRLNKSPQFQHYQKG